MDSSFIPNVYCNSRLYNSAILISKSMLIFNICNDKETQQTRWEHSTSCVVMILVLIGKKKSSNVKKQ